MSNKYYWRRQKEKTGKEVRDVTKVNDIKMYPRSLPMVEIVDDA